MNILTNASGVIVPEMPRASSRWIQPRRRPGIPVPAGFCDLTPVRTAVIIRFDRIVKGYDSLRSSFPLLTAAALLFGLTSARAEVIRHSIAAGVEYTQEIIAPPQGPLLVNVLRIDLKIPSVRVRSELAGGTVFEDNPSRGRETVGETAARTGAVAAINADFFPFTGDPLGIAVRDGELISEGLPHRVAMGIKRDGTLTFDTLVCLGSLYASDGTAWTIDGINRPLNKDELVFLGPAYGDKTRVGAGALVIPLGDTTLPIRIGTDHTATAGDLENGALVPLVPPGGALVASGKSADWLRQHIKPGDKLRLRFDMFANPLFPGPPRGLLESRAAIRGRGSAGVWTDVEQAIGGGPWLVKDGKPAVDGVEQGFRDASFSDSRHPRTAVGGTLNGELLLVTVDGRQPHSRGMTLPELADHMLKLGAYQAINLDGGGSTAMVVRGLYVNGNSDGLPRSVANSLAVFAELTAAPNGQAPEIPALRLTAGESIPLSLPIAGQGQGGLSPLWGSRDGRGFIDQRGTISARKTGTSEVGAWINGALIKVPYTVLPGPAAQLSATLSRAPNNPPDRKIVTVLVRDRFGNPVPDHTVTIRTEGGVPDRPVVTTDSAGRAEVEVVWDTEQGGKVTVSSGPLPPVLLKVK